MVNAVADICTFDEQSQSCRKVTVGCRSARTKGRQSYISADRRYERIYFIEKTSKYVILMNRPEFLGVMSMPEIEF